MQADSVYAYTAGHLVFQDTTDTDIVYVRTQARAGGQLSRLRTDSPILLHHDTAAAWTH